MAFPYIFESNFEAGTTAEWDSETDVAGSLNVRHYAHNARQSVTKVGPIAPYRGAYEAEWNLVGDTSDHTFIGNSIDIADGDTRYTRFYLFLGNDLRVTSDDTFAIYELQGTANAVEGSVGLRITNSTQAIEIGVGNTAPTVFASNKLTRGRWYCIELVSLISTGGSGTQTLWVDGISSATVTSLTNTVVARGALGTQDTLSTTFGHLYIDQFVFDDTQIGQLADRYPETLTLTKTAHIAVGNTELLNVTLINGAGTDCVLKIYDTDKANVDDETNAPVFLYNLTASEPPIDLADVPVNFRRGAYAVLTGTNPRALVHIGRSQGYRSAGRVRQHGSNR